MCEDLKIRSRGEEGRVREEEDQEGDHREAALPRATTPWRFRASRSFISVYYCPPPTNEGREGRKRSSSKEQAIFTDGREDKRGSLLTPGIT